ncbi:MAG: GLUG motif-containing protein [Sedimentisphaerales bacterium]
MKSLNQKVVILTVLILANVSFAGTYSGGNGSQSQPYQIRNPGDWQELMTTSNDWSRYFILTADVNLAGVTLTPVGNESTKFGGVFDGNHNIISNVVINQPSSNKVGLFGWVGNSGQIRNLGVENVNMTGSICVGGLVGYNDGDVNNCYSMGLVSGSSDVGGLVGYNDYSMSNCYSTGAVTGGDDSWYLGGLVGYNDDSINDCYSTGSVSGGSGSDYVGGLVGYNDYSMSNCYSTGAVTGGDNSWYLGGLVGYNDYSMSNCYSTGSVSGGSGSDYVGGLVGYNDGTISNCYFLVTSGMDNGNGTPLTDEQMKQQSSFVSWDFNAVWHICETTNYPKLKWQIVPGDFVCPDGVNFVDYSFFAERWLNTNCASNNNCDGADFDLSGTVDIADLVIFCEYWLKGF